MSSENVYLITADGKHLPLAAYGATVEDTGSIPVEYETSRGYGQHGSSVHDWRLGERVLTISLDAGGRDRRDYWQQRRRILDAIRPNRGGALTVRYVLPDGSRRDIRGWLQGGGLDAAPDGLGIDANLTILCPSPAFYDPAPLTVDLESGDTGGFSFPLAFPVHFTSGAALTATVTNAGSWHAYPVITVTGPYTGLTLRNVTTGGYLTLGVAIGSGAQRVIDLTPGAQSVVDAVGVSRITELSGGNLLDWYLVPGANLISAAISGFDGNTGISLTYRAHYIAL